MLHVKRKVKVKGKRIEEQRKNVFFNHTAFLREWESWRENFCEKVAKYFNHMRLFRSAFFSFKLSYPVK